MKNTVSLLRTRRFAPLFITQFLGAFNDNLFRTALVTLVTYHMATLAEAQKSLLVTLALGLFILPFFLFSATAGKMADKWNKARIIQIIKACEIGIIALAVVAFMLKSPPFLLGVLFLMGVHSAFFGPVKYSILPEHLKEEELIEGNGLIEAGTFLSILLGTILGGVLLAEGKLTLLLPTLLLISVGGFVTSLFIPATPARNSDLAITPHIFRSTLEVMRGARENKRVFLSILGISWFWLVGGVFLSQMPHFTKDVLFASQSVFIVLLTMFSLGIGLGSMLCNLLLKGEISSKYVPVSALLMTLFIWDIASLSSGIAPGAELKGLVAFFSHLEGWRIAADLFLFSLCGGVYVVPLYALMQARSSTEYRSRIIAANNIMNALFMVIASLISALLLLLHVTIPQLFMLVAVINAGVALYICKLLPEALIKHLFRALFSLCFRVEVRGLEHYAACKGNTLIIANHTSFLDAALLASFLPDKVAFAINTHISRNPLFRPFLSLVEAIPIDPTNPMATKTLIAEVREGKKLVIFPEGRITLTGALMKIYPGPAMIADKTGADILPIRIDGAAFSFFSRLHNTHRLRLFPKITLTIMQPRRLEVGPEITGKHRREVAEEKLYSIMSDMMFTGSTTWQTLFEALLEARELYGHHHLVVNDITRKPMSYNKLVKRAFILGDIISKQSIPGEKLGVLLPNMMGTAVTFFAMQAVGRVPAMLNFSAGNKNILLSCQAAAIHHVYTSRQFIETAKLEEVIAALTASGITIRYFEDIKKQVKVATLIKNALGSLFPVHYYRFLNRDNSTFLDANQPAVILFTSGSEGTPKGVVLSHHNLQANRQQLTSRIDFNPTDIVFNAMPMFHSFGLMGGTLLPILSGVQTFLYPSPLHYRIVPELAYDSNATILFGTDTFLAGYGKYAHAYDFHAIRYVFAGAEKLKESTRQLWAEKFGIRIFEGYGATETSPVIAVNTAMHYKPGTVGQLLPAVEYQLEKVPGIEEGGRLWVRGPNIMTGYLLQEKLGELLPPNKGWYDTGDIVSVDKEGYIRICGRAKRFAKIGGEMVSLTAVEGWISALWPDAIHAVLAVEDVKKGEQLVLITNKPDASREALIRYAKAHGVNELSIPRQLQIWEKIPLLATGKVDYVAVKERL